MTKKFLNFFIPERCWNCGKTAELCSCERLFIKLPFNCRRCGAPSFIETDVCRFCSNRRLSYGTGVISAVSLVSADRCLKSLTSLEREMLLEWICKKIKENGFWGSFLITLKADENLNALERYFERRLIFGCELKKADSIKKACLKERNAKFVIFSLYAGTERKFNSAARILRREGVKAAKIMTAGVIMDGGFLG